MKKHSNLRIFLAAVVALAIHGCSSSPPSEYAGTWDEIVVTVDDPDGRVPQVFHHGPFEIDESGAFEFADVWSFVGDIAPDGELELSVGDPTNGIACDIVGSCSSHVSCNAMLVDTPCSLRRSGGIYRLAGPVTLVK